MKRNFKVGDEVFVVKNDYGWKDVKMVVVRFYSDRTIVCRHPKYGEGGFSAEDLISANEYQRRKFKIGDKVFVTNNTVWGQEEMVIQYFWKDKFSVSCLHPKLGIGCFIITDLVHANNTEHKNKIRNEKISQLKTLREKVRNLEDELFS